jgi:pullulanase
MMRSFILLMGTIFFSSMIRFSNNSQKTIPYLGNDLGVFYSPKQTSFKVWAPNAESVVLRIYESGDGGNATRSINLAKGEKGSWFALADGDLKNKYYSFQVTNGGKTSLEVPDPYAVAVGVNGKRGMIVNLTELEPAGWKQDKRPALKAPTDIILYELHIRDLSMNPNSGIKNAGKYLGLAETGTKGPGGVKTGLDHIRELGATHVHLLPAFDHNSIDESKTLAPFNWGYDPLNYNAPEGSYSSDASDGRVRIKEFRQMVKALHGSGLRVVMDVVYNHTSNINNSVFEQFAPGYFHRKWPDGKWGNGSACGNEVASEKAMVRKYIIESLVHWVKDYHIDGFRFDLMGLHDIETMNAISDTLHKIDPTIFLYGEGWTAGDSPLPDAQRAVKKNVLQLRSVAAFSDDIRDALRGPYSDDKVSGFVNGRKGTGESLKFGIVASIRHPQIDYSKVAYSKAPWANEPSQTISYVSCHDDPTLFDRIRLSTRNITEAGIIKMDKLAQAAVLTSQGVVFIHAGEEMLRTKGLRHNTYNSPDSVNALDWSRKKTYQPVFDFYKGLIAMRKEHPAFRMPTANLIREHLNFLETDDELLVGYEITDAPGDKWKNIIVYMNGTITPKQVPLRKGSWAYAVHDGAYVEETKAGVEITDGFITIPPRSISVIHNAF